MSANKLLWLAWDAADWGVISPHLARGELPELRALIDRGTSGPLLAEEPLLSHSLWTTQASGVSPLYHGVVQPTTLRLDESGTWPVDRWACRVPRVWEYFQHAGKRSIVVNFPATHPVSHTCNSSSPPVLQITPLFASTARHDDLADSVFPPNLLPALAPLRFTPAEIDDSLLLTFIPELPGIDRSRDNRPAELAAILSTFITTHAAATALLETHAWDFAALAYTGLHQIFHRFMPYHAPCHPNVSAEDARLYSHVVVEVLRFHDLMLGRLLQLAGTDATILLTSDHGFACGPDRPPKAASNDHELQAWHRPEGIAILAGPPIHHTAFASPPCTLDVAPNILALMNVAPPASSHRMPGRVWSELFTPSAATCLSPLPPDTQPTQRITHAEKRLIEQGYKRLPDPRAENLKRRLIAEQEYYEALHLLEAKRPLDAVPLLEHAVRMLPQHRHFQIALARAFADASDWEKCDTLVAELQAHFPNSALAFAARGFCAFARNDARAAHAYVTRAIELAAPSDTPADYWRLLGETCLALSHLTDAQDAFEHAVARDPNAFLAWRRLAYIHTQRGNHEPAANAAAQAYLARARGAMQRPLTLGVDTALRAFSSLSRSSR